MFYLHLTQLFGFFCAQIFNSILALLIVKRAGKLFGAYRHVMLFFTLSSMWFSWVEILTQPVVYIKGSMLVVFIDHYNYPLDLGGWILCLHCGSFAFVISVFAVQFFYRYATLCSSKILHFFNGNRIFLIFLPCLIPYLIFFFMVHFGLSATDEKREFLKDDFQNLLDLDVTKIPFIAHFYWSLSPNGETIWHFKDLIATGICNLIIATVSFLILLFAWKTYFYMKNASENLSQRTQDINRQLFIMLTVQTVVPFVTMYIPIALVINIPFFGLGLGEFVNYTSASIAVYPMLEPLITMYCIADFRKTLKRFLLGSSRISDGSYNSYNQKSAISHVSASATKTIAS